MIKLKDFSANIKKTGYMITFRGKNIGGVGVLNCTLRGKAVTKQIYDYHVQAQSEINRIIDGKASNFYYEAIKKIISGVDI